MSSLLRIDVLNPYQNLGQATASLVDLSNLSFAPTIAELNRIWSGRGSTATDDDIDVAIAQQRLAQASLHPETVVRGNELAARLKAMI